MNKVHSEQDEELVKLIWHAVNMQAKAGPLIQEIYSRLGKSYSLSNMFPSGWYLVKLRKTLDVHTLLITQMGFTNLYLSNSSSMVVAMPKFGLPSFFFLVDLENGDAPHCYQVEFLDIQRTASDFNVNSIQNFRTKVKMSEIDRVFISILLTIKERGTLIPEPITNLTAPKQNPDENSPIPGLALMGFGGLVVIGIISAIGAPAWLNSLLVIGLIWVLVSVYNEYK